MLYFCNAAIYLILMLDPICVKGLLSSWMTVKTQKAISYYIVA